jgi:phenylpyruvate tautomerase PptA (4-oxalocrotonate tautomerase family)
MPYINVVIAPGRDAATRRRLIAELSNAITDILESRPQDVHAMLWEVPVENLGEGGTEPDPRHTNNISVLIAEGRTPDVLNTLVRRCTEVTADVLGVEPWHVHMLLHEIAPARASTAGVPLTTPGEPRWFAEERPVPARTPYALSPAPREPRG